MLVYLLYKLKAKRTDIKYILPWVILDICMIIITAVPAILNFFCGLFGIEKPSNMLFFFGMVFLAMIAFTMSLKVAELNGEVRKLAQKIALMEEKSDRSDV